MAPAADGEPEGDPAAGEPEGAPDAFPAEDPALEPVEAAGGGSLSLPEAQA
jgi:hypothetical protein